VINIEVDASDLMRWARRLDSIARETPIRLAKAMNTYGDNVVRRVVEYVTEQTGMSPDDVKDLIQVQKATRYDLSWAMDATAAMRTVGDDELFSRPFPDRDNSRFEQERLVKIVTMNDGFDCEVCQEAAEHSPYTMAEIEVMQEKWAGYQGRAGPAGPAELRSNLIHPNCRCAIAPWYSTRQLPVTFREHGAGAAPPELFTPRQFADAIRDELSVAMNVRD
jgi:hypothetical protein